MDPNQNPPSEREWTPEEMEEFFAQGIKNASEGLISTAMTNGADLSSKSITLKGLLKIQEDFEFEAQFFDQKPPGIYIQHLVSPEQGWPIAAHCTHCRQTVFVLSLYAAKPEKADYLLLKGTCLDVDKNILHNLYPQFDYPWPNRMGPRPEEWTDEAYKHYWNPLGVPK